MNQQERTKILQDIFGYFLQITQWLPNNIDIAAEYVCKAEALIEYLEVIDCGSIGGFDPDNPIKRLGRQKFPSSEFELYNRFLALIRKHNTKLKKECGFTINNMTKYFKIISELRENV